MRPDEAVVDIGSGLTMEIDPRDTGVSRTLRNNHGVFEANTLKWVLASTRPGKVFCDVGANLGYFTLFASQKVGPHGRVVAFEPMDTALDLLRRNVARNSLQNVTVERAAVANKVGKARMSAHPTNLGDSWLDTEGCEVPTTSLDAYFGNTLVDCVKVDIQGFEGVLLRGMKRQIERNPDLIIMLEYWPEGLKRSNWDGPKLLNLIRFHGFKMWDLGGTLAEEQDELIEFDPGRVNRFTNVLLTRRRLPR